jgi:hypothetical protein
VNSILESSVRLAGEAPGERIASRHGIVWLQVALITCLAGLLRIYGLENQSLWMDEVLTVLSSRTSLGAFFWTPR